jgi:hypothetical protein
MARLAKSLDALRKQVDAKFPGRSKKSDGWIGDAAHAARVSQHNPLPNGVVCALDITHDPANGMDCVRLMAELDASNDPRIYYLIFNGEIDNSDDSRSKYTGPNKHPTHLHISVKYMDPARYDDGRTWALPMLGNEPVPSAWYRGELGSRVLQNGSQGSDVTALQTILNRRYRAYSKLVVDGQFGSKTEAVVREFQKRSKIGVDGIVGRKTYKALGI